MKIAKSVVIALASSMAASFMGCPPQVQNSGGKVLENAGSVIKTGSQNLWVPSGAPASNAKKKKPEVGD